MLNRSNRPSDFPILDILGTHVHIVDNDDVMCFIEDAIETNDSRCRFIVNTGFHGLYVASQVHEYKTVVNSADLFSPDGIAAVWLSRLLGKGLKQRATSAELMQKYFERSNHTGYSSFFFGDTDETLAALKTNLEARYPNHRIVGTYSPPFRPQTEAELRQMIEMINATNPDVLWVGLGLPKQERWIHENRQHLKARVAIGVGACFGFYSGKVKRAPEWIGKLGFEWLWRLAAEPKKLWRRDLIDGPKFLLTIARNWPAIRKANM